MKATGQNGLVIKVRSLGQCLIEPIENASHAVRSLSAGNDHEHPTALRDGLISAHPIEDSCQGAGLLRSGQALPPSFLD